MNSTPFLNVAEVFSRKKISFDRTGTEIETEKENEVLFTFDVWSVELKNNVFKSTWRHLPNDAAVHLDRKDP